MFACDGGMQVRGPSLPFPLLLSPFLSPLPRRTTTERKKRGKKENGDYLGNTSGRGRRGKKEKETREKIRCGEKEERQGEGGHV